MIPRLSSLVYVDIDSWIEFFLIKNSELNLKLGFLDTIRR